MHGELAALKALGKKKKKNPNNAKHLEQHSENILSPASCLGRVKLSRPATENKSKGSRKIKGQILYCSTHLKQSTYSTHNTPMISTSRYSLRKIPMKICFSSRLCLQAATPTARCCGSSDHLLFFSRWLKPGILLRGGCKHRANQAVCNGLFWIANEAKLQHWSPAKNRG